ncbi:MAG: UDP-N-acetylmuramoyl-L-alanyl-D-glutamate--2,6-diaminopimelate ligase [Deltaproteobacteria bacterium]|jgi:UDP-N-acetylmuramoyl-L-alanyl-D-glutamate--2,6-diaminopimelate ligase|nr:UDP-N-acetylmuramoyl-L-alanyl-D-glutamate--2,6-diaminopimelate ligase [Deltaproteobacteria bacterium]
MSGGSTKENKAALAPDGGQGGFAALALAGRLGLTAMAPEGFPDPILGGVTEDSREAGPGMLFAALPGTNADGRDFVLDAVGQGSPAAMFQEPDIPGDYVRILRKDGQDGRFLAAEAARLVYGEPEKRLETFAITGTNGKSTTAYLMEEALSALGRSPGVMGTVDYHWPGGVADAPNTTPEGPLLFRALDRMQRDGADAVVMEVSSHALRLNRLGRLRFDRALFTNLSRDHLDFHQGLEDYFQAKLSLFTAHLRERERKEPGPRVASNADCPHGARVLAALGNRAVGYGFQRGEVRGRLLSEGRAGLELEITRKGKTHRISSSLLGAFNAMNLLAAFAFACLVADDPELVAHALGGAKGAPGRLSRVGSDPDHIALVDYAHSPGALEAVIDAAGRLLGDKGRLIAIFGCGGDRDKGKRPAMGMAAAIADIPILTSDNPRTEDPLSIMADAEQGLLSKGLKPGTEAGLAGKGPKGLYLKEPDRAEAIMLGARLLSPGDVLLIAGKGHEPYQIIGREKRPFDDSLEALKALRSLGKAG